MNELPPQRRTALVAGLVQFADGTRLGLPCCRECGTVQYPPRERCRNCLADGLEWVAVSPHGTLLSWTRIHASVEPFFRAHVPWPVGRVKLECGPVVLAHLGVADPRTGMPVAVTIHSGRGGAAVLVALAPGATVPAAPVTAILS